MTEYVFQQAFLMFLTELKDDPFPLTGTPPLVLHVERKRGGVKQLNPSHLLRGCRDASSH